ncbi:hypothetical protein Ae201684P_010553 [Aphanomyces euteiches]|nr:hypothetical protein Ae201684P_010553 [Aphanomyces euteiches]
MPLWSGRIRMQLFRRYSISCFCLYLSRHQKLFHQHVQLGHCKTELEQRRGIVHCVIKDVRRSNIQARVLLLDYTTNNEGFQDMQEQINVFTARDKQLLDEQEALLP